MLKINHSRLNLVLFIIILIFSLFGPHSQAIASTTGNVALSGVPYNIGDVFVSVGNGKVKHFNSQGVLLDTLDTNTVEPLEGTSGMTFDLAGNLYVTNFNDDSVSKFDNHGNLIGFFVNTGTLPAPESILVDAAGNFYVGNADQIATSPPGRLDKFDSSGAWLGGFALAVENRGVDWIDLAADQCTLFYTSEGKLIKRYNVCTLTQLPDFATLPISGMPPDDNAWALRLRPNGEVLVAASHEVFRLNSAGTIIQTYPKPAGETAHLFALTLDVDMTSFWIAGYESGDVYKIDIASGALLQSFNAGLDPEPGGGQVGGLVVFGELEARQPKLTLEPSTDTKLVGETVELAAFLTNCLNTNVFVTFTVTGANPQTGTGLASCDQIITGFSYTGVNPGTDTVVATAHTSQPPANLTSNTSTIIWNVPQEQADLSVTKSDAPDPVTAGGTLTYSLTVTNNGPVDATSVVVTDTLPAGVTFVSATSSPSCVETAGVVTCDIGDLANATSASIMIDVVVDPAAPAGTITNTASVTGNESDPDTANNTASTVTTILAVPIQCTILDDFNRPNGPLGSNWDGRTRGYRIVNNEVVLRRGGPIYWQPEAYGSDQEACVTLTRINPRSRQHALLLKVQEHNDWRQGAILVSYNARSGQVDVEARDVIAKKWNLVGSFATPVVDGDQLQAQAFTDGTVEVFINNASIGTADAGSFYVDKGGQIGLWFLGRQGDDKDDDKDNDDNDDDRESLIQARERTSNGDDEQDGDEDDEDGPSAARRALLDDFGGGTIITTPPLTLTQISSDPFTNPTSQHKTEVEPDSFSNGSTIVSVQQSGRFVEGGASNICWSTMNNAALVANGCLPGITKFASPAGTFDRVSDPAVAFDAKHGVWLVSTLAVTETPSLIGKAVLSSRSIDATATAWNNPVVVSEATGSSFYDKNWIVCDNTPTSPFYGNCYTEWDDAGLGAMLLMSTSSDGGLTWDPKKKVGIGGNTFHGLGGQPVVQPNGTVIVPYINGLPGTQILAFRSTDGGNSWGDAFVVSNVSFHNDTGGLRAFALPSVEIDGAGKVYVVWADCRFRIGCISNDIVMSTSTDGMSWTSVVRVPIGTITDGADNFIPGIAVDKTTSGATAKVAITYYYYPVASCTFATCQLDVGFVSSPDGGANWTSAAQLAGPMTLNWLPNTSLGRMVGDYISTSYGSDGLAHAFFAVAKAPTGDPDCAIATPNCDQAIYTTSNGLALATMSNASEALIAAEVGIPQLPIPLNTDEYVPDPSNFKR